METKDSKQHSISYSGLACCIKCFPISSSPSSSPPQLSPVDELPEKQGLVLSSSKPTKRKPGGWRAMPYVLGNETFERLASMGLLANFMIFLLTQFHLEQASAANVLNIWSAVGNFAPLVGAFISDALIGRFLTIGFSSFASLLGMVTLTLIAGFPQLHPPPCTSLQLLHHQCQGPTSSQMGLLILALGLLSIGTGGIRPCNIPFGVDQFDPTTDEGRKGINSFFNWYYTTFTVVLIIAITVVVYIQSNVSWVWGFGIPTFFMVGSIVLFFFGMKVYVYVKPEGSVFTGIVQALVAAYKKRGLKIPTESEENVVTLYDPPPAATVIIKLPLTSQFRFLNKGAIVLEGEVKQDGSRSNAWRLSSVQQIEEVKCILRIIPVWASGIISFVAIVQQSTFTISQALKMDRHLGPKFQIPPGSLIIISMVTLGLWVPIYDWLVVPALRKITKVETGITLLQRMGIGLVFSILSMVVAGLVERMRRASAISHGREDGVAPMSVLWLAPQLSLMGFSEAFNIIGQIEFYNRQFPENMSSIANSLFCVTMAGASYISSLLVFTLHNVTGGHGRPDWLANDINAGRIDYFYFIIAAMGVLNMVYFLVVARRYNYKAGVFANNKDEKSQIDVELNAVKL